jgi:hypothetical protein
MGANSQTRRHSDMTKREALRQWEQENRLLDLGFTREEAAALRRISMTLHRWHELECGTGEGQVTRSVERDGEEPDSKPYMRVQYPTAHGYVDRKYPIPDRETGARRRLNAIIKARNERTAGARCAQGEPGKVIDLRSADVAAFIQGDPRGVPLYILRPGDVPAGKDVESYYDRGICIY